MELFLTILLIIVFLALPYIVAHVKNKKIIKEKKEAYLREIDLTLKLRSGRKLTDEEFSEWSKNIHLLSELERNSSIEDDLDRR